MREVLEPTIGIVGAYGDLGSQMTVQAAAYFHDVVTFDIGDEPSQFKHGIRKHVKAEHIIAEPEPVTDLAKIIDRADIIHLCTVPNVADEIEEVPPDTVIIFHGSVMTGSLRAAQRMEQQGRVSGSLALAHCLMNREGRVVIGSDMGNVDETTTHFKHLKLSPVTMSVDEHDGLMAITQAPMAILDELIGERLRQAKASGLLTPSGKKLLGSLEERAANLTETTKGDLFSNPHIPGMLTEGLSLVSEYQLPAAQQE